MKKRNQKPDKAAGIFGVVFAAVCLALAILVATDSTQRRMGMASGFFLLAWGSKLVASKKRRSDWIHAK
jgi:hypothetical protein